MSEFEKDLGQRIEDLWRSGAFKHIEKLLLSEASKRGNRDLTIALRWDVAMYDRRSVGKVFPVAQLATAKMMSRLISNRLSEYLEKLKRHEITATALRRKIERAEQRSRSIKSIAFMRMDHIKGPVCAACHGIGLKFRRPRSTANRSAPK